MDGGVAIVVSIDRGNWTNGCTTAAMRFASILKNTYHFPQDHIFTLSDSHNEIAPTRSNLDAAMTRVRDMVETQKISTVWFYVASVERVKNPSNVFESIDPGDPPLRKRDFWTWMRSLRSGTRVMALIDTIGFKGMGIGYRYSGRRTQCLNCMSDAVNDVDMLMMWSMDDENNIATNAAAAAGGGEMSDDDDEKKSSSTAAASRKRRKRSVVSSATASAATSNDNDDDDDVEICNKGGAAVAAGGATNSLSSSSAVAAGLDDDEDEEEDVVSSRCNASGRTFCNASNGKADGFGSNIDILDEDCCGRRLTGLFLQALKKYDYRLSTATLLRKMTALARRNKIPIIPCMDMTKVMDPVVAFSVSYKDRPYMMCM